ncbi:MAG: nitroreductase [Gammaproteobacteria bacterium]|nr:nitroreductase [Gammaproteobacteria bacterium]
MNIIDAIKKRASTRAFLDKPVSRETVTHILDAARWAASGANIQPWKVAVVAEKTKQAITRAILEARAQGVPQNPDYAYYPLQWVEPYKSRRKDCGYALYHSLEIEKEDTVRREEAWNRNYSFFGAPIGLLFFVDTVMEKGAWIDMGMFIQNIMLGALNFGLATCPQASMAEYPDIVRKCLNLSKECLLLCGVSMGYPDLREPINQYRTERVSVEGFTTWYE